MGDVFKALADDTRRSILRQLAERPASVNEIARRFAMSRPAVSRHLRVLREAELVSMRPNATDARQFDCYAQLAALGEVKTYLRELSAFWDDKLGGLGDYLNAAAPDNE